MSIDDAVRVALRGYRARPSDVLPYYLMGLATPAVAQTVLLVGVLCSYLVLTTQNTLDPILTELEALGPFSLDDPQIGTDGTDNEVVIDGESPDALMSALEAAVTPELIAVVAVSVLAGAVTLVVVNAIISTGQVHAVYAVLANRAGLRAGVDGIARDGRRFLGLALLELALMGLLTALLIGGAIAAWVLVGGVAAALAGLVAVFAWLPLIVFVWIAFLFAPQAVVVEDVGVVAAVRRNLGFVRRNLVTTGLYVVLLIAVGIATSTLTALFQFVGTPTLSALIAPLVVLPVLDFVKTWLFARDRTDEDLVPRPPEVPLRRRFGTALRRGWTELGSFVRSTPTYLAASTGVFVLSGYAGWALSVRLDTILDASIGNRLVGWFPPTEAVTLAANNWQVGIAEVYSGLAAGIPSAVVLFYNGFFLGALTRFETDRLELLAFVIPHGIIEIPAILIAGAMGLYLGHSVIRLVRGRYGRDRITADIERAYHVIVGLLVLFAVAGVIEAFVSPYYYGLLGI